MTNNDLRPVVPDRCDFSTWNVVPVIGFVKMLTESVTLYSRRSVIQEKAMKLPQIAGRQGRVLEKSARSTCRDIKERAREIKTGINQLRTSTSSCSREQRRLADLMLYVTNEISRTTNHARRHELSATLSDASRLLQEKSRVSADRFAGAVNLLLSRKEAICCKQ